MLSWLLWQQIYNAVSSFMQQCCLGCYGHKYKIMFLPSCSLCCLSCYGGKYTMMFLPSCSNVVLVAMAANIQWCFFLHAAMLSWLLQWQNTTMFPSCSKSGLSSYGSKYITFPPWWSYAVLAAIVVSIYIYNHVLLSSSKVALVAMEASIRVFFLQAATLSWLL